MENKNEPYYLVSTNWKKPENTGLRRSIEGTNPF